MVPTISVGFTLFWFPLAPERILLHGNRWADLPVSATRSLAGMETKALGGNLDHYQHVGIVILAN